MERFLIHAYSQSTISGPPVNLLRLPAVVFTQGVQSDDGKQVSERFCGDLYSAGDRVYRIYGVRVDL
jgi:hypothetical protein